MTHVLFVCSQGMKRSPTAAAMWWMHDDIYPHSGGVRTMIEHDWADLRPTVFCFEEWHREKIRPHYNGPIIVLNIEDKYDYMDPDLIQLIAERVGKILPPPVMDAEYMEGLAAEYRSRQVTQVEP